MPHKPGSILFVLTSSVSADFFRGQLRFLADQGWAVAMAATPAGEGELAEFGRREGVRTIPLTLARGLVNPIADLRCLAELVRIMRRERPEIANVGTPKAGLVGGLAALLTGVPVRIYTLHGLRLETATGWKKVLLTAAERVAMACAHQIVCVSPSLRRRAAELGLADAGKLTIAGPGSINGIDTAVCADAEAGAELRRELGLDGHQVVGFVGRMARDKGLADLMAAFRRVHAERPRTKLLLVGPDDPEDPLDRCDWSRIENDADIVWTGHVRDVGPYYSIMDVFTLPTYREGLGIAALEAASHGVPIVCTDATGARDTVVDGVTGRTFLVGDRRALAEGLLEVLADPGLAARRGRAGRSWVRDRYARSAVWRSWDDLYRAAVDRSRSRQCS